MTPPIPGAAEIEVASERLQLLPSRALWWPGRDLLLVADPHFGKAATFRAAGVPVPSGTTAATLERLDDVLRQTGAHHLVFLGDFFHAREGLNGPLLEQLLDWRRRTGPLRVTLVRGNHDRRAGDPPPSLGFEIVNALEAGAHFLLLHHPVPHPGRFVLAGHVHPCVTLRGPARERLRLPCFWFGGHGAVLPAFGEFTGCAEVTTAPGDRLWVVADGAVVPAPPAGPSARPRSR